MPKTKLATVSIIAAGLLLALQTPAQQTPPANSTTTPPAAAKPATAPKSTQTPGAKTGTAKAAPGPLTLSTQKQKVSYALGLGLGKNLKRDEVEVDPAIFLRGLKDAQAGGKSLMTDDEAKNVITQLQNDMRERMMAKAKAAALENKMKSDAFLAANKTKEGVVTLPSGLQYKIVTPGTGPKPAADDTIVCNYRGTLVDGTEFDSSYKRNQPLTIQVDHVIKGWTEAMQLMPVGSKWQLVIPPDLAYGERPPSPQIPPNAALVFDVELISIQPKPAKEAPKEAPKDAPKDQPQAQPKDQSREQPKEQPKAQAPASPQTPAPQTPKP